MARSPCGQTSIRLKWIGSLPEDVQGETSRMIPRCLGLSVVRRSLIPIESSVSSLERSVKTWNLISGLSWGFTSGEVKVSVLIGEGSY